MIKLTEQQLTVITSAREMIEHGQMNVTLGGLAGTGKTTLLMAMAEQMGLGEGEIAYCAFTGKAATVINRKYPQARATTIHKLIYRAADVHCDTCLFRTTGSLDDCDQCDDCTVMYTPKPELPSGLKLIVCDESSMVPQSIYDTLTSYGVPVLWIGDHGQLGPVRSAFNLMEYPQLKLEQIHRHAAHNPILKLAMRVRSTGQPPPMNTKAIADDLSVTIRRTNNFPGWDEGEWESGEFVVLVPTNAMRALINKSVRAQLGRRGKYPKVGDRVVCLRNNDETGVFNGMTGTVTFRGEINSVNHSVMLHVDVDGEDRVYMGRVALDQFYNQKTLQQEIPRKEMDLWDFAYALTVHKAQGSEYERVVLVLDLAKVPGGDKQRWMYTAITRAKRRLEIICPAR